MLAGHAEWTELHTVVHIHTKRQSGAEVSEEDRYYLCSLSGDTSKLAARVLEGTRSHWGIENQLHWVLDVTFQEDLCRVRSGNAAENLAVLRHFVVNLLRREQASRLSVRAKRLKAAWDNRYLLKLLAL